jgi:subtilisin family serine protease
VAWFSSYGLASTDLGAPGVDILSTLPFTMEHSNGYASCSGTSMAAPHVAGVAALVWSQFPDMEWSEIEHRILASTDPLSDLAFITASGGRLNAHAALTYVGGPAVTPHSLKIALGAGERVTRTITIDSVGVDSLNWSIDSSASWVQVTPISGTAVLGHPVTVTLVMDSRSLPYGINTTVLTVTPDNPELSTARFSIAAKLFHTLLDAPQTMLALGNADSYLGRKVALDGDVALVFQASENIAQALHSSGTAWFLSGQFPVSDNSGTAKFAMAVDDGRILIGNRDAEEAYVYRWDGEGWSEAATLRPSDAQSPIRFGISGDIEGDIAVVGAPGIGAAYVYRWNGSDWIEEGKLMPNAGSSSLTNVDAVAISGDTVAVGDWSTGANIYHWDGTSWTWQAQLAGDGSVAPIYGDIAVVGGNNAAYVYRRDGGQWRLEKQLTSSDESKSFGFSIDVSHNLIAIGDPANRAPDGFLVGAVYVYHWNGYRWGEAKVAARDRPPCTILPGTPPYAEGVCDWFGISVAIDEGKMLAGSYAYDHFAGAAFLYDLADLTVENAPSLGLSMENLVVYDKGASVTRTLFINNPGAETLNWSLTPMDDVDWLAVTPISGAVLPGGSQAVELVFDGGQEQAATLQTSLIILSNDPFGARVEFPITLYAGWDHLAYLPLVVR